MTLGIFTSNGQEHSSQLSTAIAWLEFIVLLVIVIAYINLYALFVPEELHKLTLGSNLLQALLLGICIIHGSVVVFGSINSKRVLATRMACVVITILFTLGIPTALRVSIRETVNPLAIHDSAIQTEAAYDNLVAGKNPYAATYEKVFSKGAWNPIYLNGRWVPNPAVDHYIYLPGQIIIEGGFGAIEKAVFGFRDARILSLLSVFALAGTMGWLLRKSPFMLSLVLLFTANPVVIHFLTEGRNDFIVLTLLCFAFLALLNKRLFVAALLFGLACTTKQFAWACIPFVLIYLWKIYGWRSRETIRFVAIVGGIVALAVIPFLIANAQALIDDVIRFPAGSATSSQLPINGYGFSPLVTAFGVSDTAYFPFWIFMAVATIPLFIIFGRAIFKNPKPSLVMAASMLTLFAGLLFSRFLQQNYVMFILQAMCWAMVLMLVENSNERTTTV